MSLEEQKVLSSDKKITYAKRISLKHFFIHISIAIILLLGFPLVALILSQYELACNNEYEPISIDIRDYLIGYGISGIIYGIIYILIMFNDRKNDTPADKFDTYVNCLFLMFNITWIIIGCFVIFKENYDCISEEVTVIFSIFIWTLLVLKVSFISFRCCFVSCICCVVYCVNFKKIRE